MAVVGIDFGTCNSVIAVWDEGRRQSRVPVLPGVSRETRYRIGDEWHSAHVIPSLIAYEGNEVLIGEQVYSRNLEEGPQTFRWMKAYISAQQPHPRRVASAQPGHCLREVPVTSREADGTILDGVIDLAFFHEGAWVVVDFKTDRELEAGLDVYKRQVALYAMMLSKATKQDARGVLLRV